MTLLIFKMHFRSVQKYACHFTAFLFLAVFRCISCRIFVLTAPVPARNIAALCFYERLRNLEPARKCRTRVCITVTRTTTPLVIESLHASAEAAKLAANCLQSFTALRLVRAGGRIGQIYIVILVATKRMTLGLSANCSPAARQRYISFCCLKRSGRNSDHAITCRILCFFA